MLVQAAEFHSAFLSELLSTAEEAEADAKEEAKRLGQELNAAKNQHNLALAEKVSSCPHHIAAL